MTYLKNLNAISTRNVSPASFVKGEDVDLSVYLSKDGDIPFSLTGLTSASAFFLNADESTLTVGNVTVVNTLGKLNIALTDTETALLAASDEASFELELNIGSEKTIVQFIESLSIKDRVFT